jgi:hypothetical protein
MVFIPPFVWFVYFVVHSSASSSREKFPENQHVSPLSDELRAGCPRSDGFALLK